MSRHFVAERATLKADGSSRFVVVDGDFEFHLEATAYTGWLRALGRSVNTERAYASRIARFLTYCEVCRLDWHRVSPEDLARYLNMLVTEPIRKDPLSGASPKFRANKTANANLTAVCEFLRFAASRGWVDGEIVAHLSQPKYLRRAPAGYDWGENQQFREVRARSLMLREVDRAPQALTDEEIATVVKALPQQRDRLLVRLLSETGMRIGEALGLRREDMHLLSTSAALGCRIQGPHVHVTRRLNTNGAAAKSRMPRSIPVTPNLVQEYTSYLNERTDLADPGSSDFVFVNMKRVPIGSPMTYHNAKKVFERVSRTVDFEVRPHMLRHSAATRWLASGTSRDVVQALLGHVSPQSMEVYYHPTDAEKRSAVDKVDGAEDEA